MFTYGCTNKVNKKEGNGNVKYKHTANMLPKGLKGLESENMLQILMRQDFWYKSHKS